MMVHGIEFPESLLEMAWEMACERGLSHAKLREAFMDLGYREGDFLDRAADRLLQRKRKAGACRYHKGKWEVLK